MKYLKSLKKSEVGSNEFYSNKSEFFSNGLPYAVLTAIDDDYSNDITIKYLWTNSNSITIYGQSNGYSNDFYLKATAPTCVGISNGSEVYATLNYFLLDNYHLPNFSDNSKITKLALHELINLIDGNYISNGVNVDPQYSNGFGNLDALYLMNTTSAVTINNKPNAGFAQNTDLYVPSNLSTLYSSSVYEGFKSVNYF